MVRYKAIAYCAMLWLLSSIVIGSTAYAQPNTGVYIDPNKSPKSTWTHDVVISGNRVVMYVANHGSFGDYNGRGSTVGAGVWPRGTNHDHIVELVPILAAKVPVYLHVVDNTTGNTTLIPDNSGRRVVVVDHHYSDHISQNNTNTYDAINNVPFAFEPLAGYMNIHQVKDSANMEIANQLNPDSWPPSWPGKDNTWSGYWNGYFGKRFNADQEAYYVMDDVWNDRYPFYPNMTDTTRRGLGFQVETRCFQWANPLAQDDIFMHFQVANTGTHSYSESVDSLFFGIYGDINIGGIGMVNDVAAYDSTSRMVYGWAYQNQVSGGWNHKEILPGYMGWKFLETPGKSFDNKDNDYDGLVDESRDNDSGIVYRGHDAIIAALNTYFNTTPGASLNNFLKFYNYQSLEDVPAVKAGVWWTGDENANWDWRYDDVGADGIGPRNSGWTAPDLDGSEGNGRPDQGEPHFGKTDKDESDQIPLTSFNAPTAGLIMAWEWDEMWPLLSKIDYAPPQNLNQVWLFSVGTFNFNPNDVQRFSCCVCFGVDQFALYRSASVAQRIYNAGYQFATPPIAPILHAIAGDHKVTLIWDSLAEGSKDPIYGNDFEGYKVIRSTDPAFTDAALITDAYGTVMYTKPIAQFDLSDGLVDLHPVALGQSDSINVVQSSGVHYYMGSDNGLQHYYVDTLNIINGRTYYYAVISYDKGYYKDFYQRGLSTYDGLNWISPQECPASIQMTGGVITHVDVNCAIVTPNTNPTNYISATSDAADGASHTSGHAAGKITVDILDNHHVPDGHYVVAFKDSALYPSYTTAFRKTTGFSVYDSTNHKYLTTTLQPFSNFSPLPGQKAIDTLDWPNKSNLTQRWTMELLDQGITVNFTNNYSSFDSVVANAHWENPTITTLQPNIVIGDSKLPALPISFVIEFGDSNEVLDTALITRNWEATGKQYRHAVNFKVTDLYTGNNVLYYLKELNNAAKNNGMIDTNESINIGYKVFNSKFLTEAYRITFGKPDTAGQGWTQIRPQKGDKFIVRAIAPFTGDDVFEFTTKPESVDKKASPSSALSKVTVVPNPYIESAIWEQLPQLRGRGERKIYFNNLPAQCTIRIYTMNGLFLKEIPHIGNSAGLGSESWNLTTKDGLEVASGLYIYHIDAPGIGSTIGKFAIVN